MERVPVISSTDIITVPDGFEIAIVEGTHIVYFPVHREIVAMNQSGAGLIQEVNGCRSLGEVIRAYCVGTETTPASVFDSARAFFEDLLEKGLVVKMADASRTDNDIMYIVNPEVISEDSGDGGLVLYNSDTQRRLHLNATAGVMWRALRIPRTMRGVYQYFCARVDVESDDQTIQQELKDFVESMYQQGFIGIVLEKK